VKIVLDRILVPIDFSDESRAALTYAAGIAEVTGASLHLLHVLETTAGADPLIWQIDARTKIEGAIEKKALEELDRLLSAEDQTRLRAKLDLEWGSPYDEILRYAQSRAINLIVMGTHGRGGIAHLIIGSVAENVVRSAPCPVLTVRHPEREFVLPPGGKRARRRDDGTARNEHS
jgi:nucleotide-binding universal stress UspA family protein